MNPEAFKRTFKLPFVEAEHFFLAKLNIPTLAWDELSGAAHARGFMSAGAYQADLLADLRKMTDKAIAGGMDIREFRKQFLPLVERYGWQLKGGGPAWRSDLIWRTNIATANAAGRWQQFEDAGIDYLRYDHNDSVTHPRPKHVALDGKILPRTDPFWIRNYPPQGFGCRCRAVAATEQEFNEGDNLRPQGWETMADPGWDYNVGLEADKGYKILGDKFEKLPVDIAHEWMQRWVQEPAFALFIDGKLAGNFPVAVLDDKAKSAIGAKSQTAWLSADSLSKNKGEQPLRSKGHPELTLDDYRLLPEIIGRPELIIEENGTQEVFIRREKSLYMAVLKTTKTGEALFVTSLRKMTMAEVEKKKKLGNVVFDGLR